MDETLAVDKFEPYETRSISALAKSTTGSKQSSLDSYSSIAVLPGHGSPGSDCGNSIEMFCRTCGNSFWAYSSCMMRECPDCYEKWASKEGSEASFRLWQVSLILYAYPVRKMHCVVSLPDRGETVEELREKTRKILKSKGLTGGCLIPHPFRQDDDFQYVPDGYLHCHAICIAPGDIKPGKKGELYGAIFKVIPDAQYGDYRGLRDRISAKRLIQYLLTHCGLVKGKHALTWFGVASYNSLSNEKLEASDPIGWNELRTPKERICPLCGSSDTEPCLQMDWTRGLCVIRVHDPPNTEPHPPNSAAS